MARRPKRPSKPAEPPDLALRRLAEATRLLAQYPHDAGVKAVVRRLAASVDAEEDARILARQRDRLRLAPSWLPQWARDAAVVLTLVSWGVWGVQVTIALLPAAQAQREHVGTDTVIASAATHNTVNATALIASATATHSTVNATKAHVNSCLSSCERTTP